MTYVALARKWRPQRFDDLVGQEPTARTLKNSVTLGRVAHAILFAGPRGVGKTTVARILAKALNCEKGESPDPCGECSNCREIAGGSNVDVLEIDGASNTHVEDIREVLDNVRYAPSKSRHKIYIIDEVHMLSKNAFNALLKTLEEPPSGVIFLFATTEPHRIPDTILSRCQRFDLLHIPEEKIAKQIEKIAASEKIAVNEGARAVIARQSEGSLRDALSILDRVVAFTGPQVTEEDVASILGLTDRELIRKTLEAFTARDTPGALSALEEVWSQGYDPKTYVNEVWGKVRDLLVLKSGADVRLVHGTAEEISQLRIWSVAIEAVELERWFDLLRRVSADIGRSEFPRYLLEVTFLRIARNEPRIPITDWVERLTALEAKLAGGVSQPVAVALPSPTPARSLQKPESSPNWDSLINHVKRNKPALAAVLLQATDRDISRGVIRLGYEEGSFYISRAKEPDFQDYLLTAAKELFGELFRLDVRTQPKTDRTAPSPVTVDRQREREALEHPAIQRAVSLFDAKIEEIKPTK